ncbi:MAG TPA: S53 family peptidase [Ktedonosporobacter sp.]|jgi:subtilase family serine protease|nr:S53 family peptidase [Ktedonosporobacter sp.]
MSRFRHFRLLISAGALFALLVGLIGSVAPFSPTAHAATNGAGPFDGSVTANPVFQPAGGMTDAVFNCQTNRGPQFIVCYSPQQIRQAYHIDRLLDAGITGKGRTIVIVDAFQDPFVQQELAAFDTVFGLPAPVFNQIAPDGLTPFDPTNPSQTGFAGEIALDVQWAHAVAPDAKIDLVLAKTNNNVDLVSAIKFAVDHNLGDVISQSFGENESCFGNALLKQLHGIYAQATRKHITIFASSGDQGAAQRTCDGNSWTQAASAPASDPLVTAVGATELFAAPDCNAAHPCPAVHPTPGTYDHEIALNEAPGLFTPGNFSTGGGFSVLFKRPEFQEDVRGIPAGHRGLPDISYSGSINHGVVVACGTCAGGANPAFFIFGGTSVGSPNWAGLIALGDQMAGHRLGFINNTLYQIGRFDADDLHDITVGNNSVQEPDSTGTLVSVAGFNTQKGWDAATGLGTPKVNQLIPLLVALKSDRDDEDAAARFVMN